MAEFNPQVGVANADYTGASRGMGPNRAFEALFEGIANVGQGLVNGIDQGIQQNIREEVQAGYDTVNEIYGVDDTAQLFAAPNEAADLPGDINAAKEYLPKLAKAYQQGSIKESHYYARLEAQVRQLRSKYPGYRDQIDQIVGEVTGVTPANALRRSLMAEWEAEADNASANEKRRAQLLEHVAKSGYPVPQDWQQLGEDQLLNLIRDNEAEKWNREKTLGRLQELKASGDLTAEDALKAAKGEVETYTARVMKTSMPSVETIIASAQEDGTISSEELAAIKGSFTELKTTMLAHINNDLISRPWNGEGSDSYSTVLSGDQIKQVQQLALDKLAHIEDAITNQNFGIIAHNRILAENADQEAIRTVQTNHPEITIMGAVKNMMGEAAVNLLLMENASVLSSIQAGVTSIVSQAMAVGRIKSLQEGFNQLQESKVSNPTAYRQLIKNSVSILQSGTASVNGQTVQAPLAMRENAARALFSEENLNFLDEIGPSHKEKLQTYLYMTSPQMTQTMRTMGGEHWKNYTTWTVNNFMGMYKGIADTITSGANNPFVDIQWDNNAGQFVAKMTGKKPGQLNILDTFKEREATAALSAVSDINKALLTIKPIMQESGLDLGLELGKLTQAMGVELDGDDQPTFFEKLGQQVLKNLSTDPTQRKNLWELGEDDEVLGPLAGKDGATGSIFDGIALKGRKTKTMMDRDVPPEPVLGDFELMDLQDTMEKITSGDGTYGKLLDFIGGLEAPQGYNQVYGKNRIEPLDQMSVAEVFALQKKMVKENKTSSAVGRYQFINKTLAGLVDEMGIGLDEKFTPELQDRLAAQLLKRRGADAFLKGETSKEVFLNSLAKEWASVPTTAGQSYYAGDRAGNKALTTSDKALAFLDSVAAGGGLSEANAEAIDWQGIGYGNIPEKERQDFLRWNNNPIKNSEENLKTVKPEMQEIVRRAQELAGVKFVVGSGARDKEKQKVAVELGWSKTLDSEHADGNAADIWVLDDNGQITFKDEARYKQVAEAMLQAAEELGYEIDWGGNWKKFKDIPHFELKRGKVVVAKG